MLAFFATALLALGDGPENPVVKPLQPWVLERVAQGPQDPEPAEAVVRRMVEPAVRQAEPEETPEAGLPETEEYSVDLGEFELVLTEEQPIQHCVIERYDRVVGDTVLLITAYLTPSGPFAAPPTEVLATGPLGALPPFSCVGAGGVVTDADTP